MKISDITLGYQARLTLFVALCVLSGAVLSADASTLALYEAQPGSNGDFDTTAFDSVDTEIRTTATRLVQGGSLTGGGAANFILANILFDAGGSGSPGYNLADVATASQSAAATAGDYFSFTMQSGGLPITYTNLCFYSDQYDASGKVDVSYTVGGVETFVLTGYVPIEGNVDVTLKTIDFTDFTTVEDVTWTFYLYAATASNFGTRFDDIKLSGYTTLTTLALYDAETGLDGNFNTTAFDSVDVDGDSTATRLTQGGSLTGGGANTYVADETFYDASDSGSPGFNFGGVETSNRLDAAAAGDYFSFTFFPGIEPVTISDLSFYSNQSSSSAKIDVSYILKGVETFILTNHTPVASNGDVAQSFINLTNLTTTAGLTFRFYLYGASGVNYGTRFDDITLTGYRGDSPARKLTSLTPSASIKVSDLTTSTNLGTVDDSGCEGTYVVRARTSLTQNSLQIQTFIKFDLSSLKPAIVNDPFFSAKFRIDYAKRLNTVNALDISLGRNTSGLWDLSGSNNPLHDWGFNDDTSTIIAEDLTGTILTVSVANTPPKSYTNDVTATICDWVNGVYANDGFVLMPRQNENQGAGFENAELIVNTTYASTLGATVIVVW